MNIDAVVTQLKTYAPVFNGNVAGAAQFAQAVENQSWLPRPAAYVIPLEDETEGLNANQTGLYQLVREKIGIIVDLDNSPAAAGEGLPAIGSAPGDRRGQAAATQAVNAIRAAVWAAVLNWRPDPDNQSRGFSYAGGGLVGGGMDRARLRWQFDFVIETTITEYDGWQPTGTPLTGIAADMTTSGGAKAGLDLTFPPPS